MYGILRRRFGQLREATAILNRNNAATCRLQSTLCSFSHLTASDKKKIAEIEAEIRTKQQLVNFERENSIELAATLDEIKNAELFEADSIQQVCASIFSAFCS